MSPSSVPLDLAALRGLLAHGCFLSGLVSRSRGGIRRRLLPNSIQQRCSQQAPEGAVLPEGVGQERAAGGLRIFSPQTAVVYYTQEKTTNLKMQTREAEELRGAEEHCCRLCMSSSSLTRRGSGAPGSLLQTPTRPYQLLLGSFILLYFSLTCQDFVVFFFFFCGGFFFSEFLKNLGRGAATGKREGL